MRTCFSLPDRHNSRTAHVVVDISSAAVGMLCKKRDGVGATNGTDWASTFLTDMGTATPFVTACITEPTGVARKLRAGRRLLSRRRDGEPTALNPNLTLL